MTGGDIEYITGDDLELTDLTWRKYIGNLNDRPLLKWARSLSATVAG